MIMHEFAFVQKMPGTNIDCLTPTPCPYPLPLTPSSLNAQLTLSGGKVNMSTTPN